jgi:TatD DNase family protein
LIDTHCHLDASRFDTDREAVLERAWAAGLSSIVVPGVGPSDWELLLSWKNPRVPVALGVHPQLLPELPASGDDKMLADLDALLARGGSVAVGECGLDGPSEPGAPMDRQLSVLRAHFALARKHRLPLIVHVLRAHPHFKRLIQEEPIPARGLLMHSYSGSVDFTPGYARYGCHFSFAGPVTFEGARRPIEALKKIPLERLMAETDAPDQAPHPHRGGRCEPAYLPLIIEGLARGLGKDVEAVRAATTENAKAFFRL